MLHVEEEHAARVRVVAAVHAREHVVDIVLGQHDFFDPREFLRLVFAHPEDFRRGEAREGDVRGERRESGLADLIVEIIDLRLGAAVVPEDRAADDRVVFVEDHQPVHLAAAADPGDGGSVRAAEQLLHAVEHGGPPVGGLLLGPAGLREVEPVFPADLSEDRALLVHKRQLDGGRAEIDSDKQLREYHLRVDFVFFLFLYLREGRGFVTMNKTNETGYAA